MVQTTLRKCKILTNIPRSLLQCSNAVIPGINDMVSEMKVGQKVQAIIPAELAFGDKGICIENKEGKEECLVKPGSKLVYDIYLKKSSIPPP